MVPAASRSRRTSPALTEGELVDVADQQQMRSGRDGPGQLAGQDHVHHRGLVHDDQIGVQGVVSVVFGVAAGLQFQQPVHGGRVVAGQLRQPLGGPAGGRDQHHGGVLGRGELDDGADGEALPAAGAAGQHGHRLREGELGRLLLGGGQVLPGPGVQPSQCLAPVHGPKCRQPLLPGVQQGQQPGRQGLLGPVEGHQVDRREQIATLTGYQFADDALGGDELVQARADQVPVHLEDLGGIGDQVGLREVAVPVVGGLRQGVLQPCLDPFRAVVRDPDGLSDGVGGLEPDAPHLRHGAWWTKAWSSMRTSTQVRGSG